MADDEELIGDSIFGGAPYYQQTSGGPRARYLVLLGGDSIYSYASHGTYPATLHVRRVHTTWPEDSASQTLAIAGPLWVGMTGRDEIHLSGTYTWTSMPFEGVPPYDTYRWYYQQGGSSEYLDGTDRVYQRYVSAKGAPYVFRLRTTVQDAIPTTAVDTLWVDVVRGGNAPASLGLLDANGTCRALPADRLARQAAHSVIARSGRWPQLCEPAAP